MTTGNDILSRVRLAAEDTDLVLTIFFTGGPVTGFVSLGSEQRPLNFAADPFFRRQENYVASGCVFISCMDTTERRRAISVLFTNASNAPALHRIELSSPRKLNFAEAPSGTDSPARLFVRSGNVPVKESIQYVIVVEH